MDEKYTIVEDEKYGFLRVDPIPSQQEVDKFYKEEFYSTEYKQFNDSSMEVQLEEEEFYKRYWESNYQKVVQFFGRKDDISLFDVGCGFALGLKYYMDKGFTVSGLDPAPEAVEYAKKQNLDVHLAGINEFSCVGDERFDVVTIVNALEHLRNPAETLLDVKKYLLKSNGLLMVDVPNEFNDFQVVANTEHNLGEWWLCPPNHINYFSVSSLKNLFDKCGYVIKSYETSFPLEMFLVMGDVYVGNPKLGKQCHNKRVHFEEMMRKHGKEDKLRKFYEALADCDLGRQVVMYATPK